MIDKLRPKYQAALEKAKRESTPEKKKGVGVAIGIYGCGLDGVDAAEVEVELTKTGVTVFANWHDHGQGADMGVLGTAHEALQPLGLKPDQIKLVMNDTAVNLNGGPAGGSRSQVFVGNAIKNGCENLIKAMHKSGNKYRSYDDMVAEGLPLKYKGSWASSMNTNCDANTAQGKPFTIYMYGVFMAEVAVEVKSGKTKVEGLTLVADIGKINNKLVVDGQIYGGLAQGVGLALSEDFEDYEIHSNMLGAGIPYAKDVPDKIDIIYVETPRENGPFGAAGVGELPLTAPHAAIANAVKHAVGVEVRHLPIRPPKLLAALKEKEKPVPVAVIL